MIRVSFSALTFDVGLAIHIFICAAQRHCREQELRLRLANLHVELGELHIQHLMTLSDMMSEFGHDEEHCDATQTSRVLSIFYFLGF